jgi:hypothetical protein
MRATNFNWHDSIHVRLGGEDFDLHNDFDFRQFVYDPGQQLLLLEWQRRNGNRSSRGQPKRLTFHLVGVARFSFSERDPEIPFSEDECLASFGYCCDEDGVDGQFWIDKHPDDHWAWSFIFQSGAEIRVSGEAATIEVSRD